MQNVCTYSASMDLTLSKGQGQGQANKAHRMKITHECHVTHALCRVGKFMPVAGINRFLPW